MKSLRDSNLQAGIAKIQAMRISYDRIYATFPRGCSPLGEMKGQQRRDEAEVP